MTKTGKVYKIRTSDKRATKMVKALMANFDKVNDKQSVLAMLSDIKHSKAYLSSIKRVPKEFLFMFVANPLRNDYYSKQVFERRMNM